MRNYNIGLDEGFDEDSISSLFGKDKIVKKVDAVRHNFVTGEVIDEDYHYELKENTFPWDGDLKLPF